VDSRVRRENQTLALVSIHKQKRLETSTSAGGFRFLMMLDLEISCFPSYRYCRVGVLPVESGIPGVLAAKNLIGESHCVAGFLPPPVARVRTKQRLSTLPQSKLIFVRAEN